MSGTSSPQKSPRPPGEVEMSAAGHSPGSGGEAAKTPGLLSNAGAELGPLKGPAPGSGKRWSLQQLRAGEAIVPIQSGTNKFSSQKGSTGFGTPRDVKGKHLKRIWELEYPEECAAEQKN